MKVSIALSVPENSSPSEFSRFQEQVKKASELDYDGIELNIRDPVKIDQDKLLESVSNHGLEIPNLITGKAFTLDGLSLADADEVRRDLAIRRINAQISLAARASAFVLIGWIRGRWEPHREEAHRLFVNSLRLCGKYAEDRGVLLGIEPLNRYEVDSIYRIDEAASILEEIGLPNIGIIADTFHMNIEEHDPIYEAVRRCGDRLFHVHIADNNRMPPGMGHLPFRRFFEALRSMGYERFVSVEVVPLVPDFETVAERSMGYLRRIRAF